jgi:hypothetical protein
MNDQERTLVEKAISSLKKSSGLQAQIGAPDQRKKNDRESGEFIKLCVRDHQQRYFVVIKNHLTNNILGYLIAELKNPRSSPGILVTRYVTPQQAEKLRLANVQFIDTAGNAYINHPPLYILITGNRLHDSGLKIKKSRFFSTTGIRVLFVLLCQPALVSAPYREIATAAGVSLGAVSQVMEDLKGAGYLFNQAGHERRLINHQELIRRWGEAYAERLRPNLLISRFRSNKSDWWRDVRLEEVNACWSGEVAAAKLTGYLRPQNKSIYAPNKLASLQLKFDFREERNGDIELLNKFWNFDQDTAHPDTAPAILVYADLIESGDERNIEAAQMIYDRYIIRSFGQT